MGGNGLPEAVPGIVRAAIIYENNLVSSSYDAQNSLSPLEEEWQYVGAPVERHNNGNPLGKELVFR
jgi:hypothetical protein